jgi:hypothetical protein
VKRTWAAAGCPADAWPLAPADLGEPQHHGGGELHGEALRCYSGGLEEVVRAAIDRGQVFELTIDKLSIRISPPPSAAPTPQA